MRCFLFNPVIYVSLAFLVLRAVQSFPNAHRSAVRSQHAAPSQTQSDFYSSLSHEPGMAKPMNNFNFNQAFNQMIGLDKIPGMSEMFRNSAGTPVENNRRFNNAWTSASSSSTSRTHAVGNSGAPAQMFRLPEIQTGNKITKECDPKTATLAQGKLTCEDKFVLIFEDNFDKLDLQTWEFEQRFAEDPDYEFCFYTDSTNNTYVKNGILYIRPTLVTDTSDEEFLKTGEIKMDEYPPFCTEPIGDSKCRRSGQNGYRILPPVMSARIRTKKSFRFRYGIIEVKAKMASGDWIYSDIALLPAENHYGLESSGQIFIATLKGNEDLRNTSITTKNVGNKYVEHGVNVDRCSNNHDYIFNFYNSQEGFDKKFRTYSFEWKHDSMKWQVGSPEIDNVHSLSPPKEGFLDWENADKMAPFDREFFVSIGLGVGGVRRFPDNFRSNGKPKPWKNFSPKGMLNFWNDKKNWHKTWQGEESALQIDHVKVWALPHSEKSSNY